MKKYYAFLGGMAVIFLVLGGGTLIVSAIFQDLTGRGVILTGSRLYFYTLIGSLIFAAVKKQGEMREIARFVAKIQFWILAAVFAGITFLAFIRPEAIIGEWWEVMIFQGLMLSTTATFCWLGSKV